MKAFKVSILIAALVAGALADVYKGTVVDAGTKLGIAGVSVTLKGKPSSSPVITDASGAFSLNTALAIISGDRRREYGLAWNPVSRTISWGPGAGEASFLVRDAAGRVLQVFSTRTGNEFVLSGGVEGVLAVEATVTGRRRTFLLLDAGMGPPVMLGETTDLGPLAKEANADLNTLVFMKSGYRSVEVPVDGDRYSLTVEMAAEAPFAGVLFKSLAERVKFNVEVGVADTVSNVRASVTGGDLNVKFLKPNTETYGPTGAPQEQKQNNFVFDLGRETDATAFKSLRFRMKSNVAVKVWIFAGKVPVTDPHVLTYLKAADGTTDYYYIPAGVDEEISLSLDHNFIGVDRSRLRGITFRTASGEGCPLERPCATWPDMQITLSNVRLAAEEAFRPRVKRAFLPPEGKKYLVIGQGIEGIDNFYARNPQNRPAGIMGYLSTFDWNFGWGDWGGTQSGMDLRRILLNPAHDGGIIQVGLGMWLAEPSGQVLGRGCKEIAAGKYDIYLDIVADRVKQMRRPVFLRLNHELDNPSHLCSTPQNVGTEYAGAVEHIVERFHRRGVKNAAYVMHLWTWGNQQFWADWMKMPFVDKYMDWVGTSSLVDGIDAGNINNIAALNGKPVMIAEFARNGGATPEWMTGAFQYVKNSPRLKMMCLINQNAVFGPVRFTEFSAQHMASYESGAADPAFLKHKDVRFRYTETDGMEMAW